MKIPKIKLSTLIIFALGCAFMAYFGFWSLMATLFGLWAIARVCGAILRFIGRSAGTTWRIANSKRPFADPFLQKDIKTLFK